MSASAIIGCILGILGGIIGTYLSIKNAMSPTERSFIVKATIVTWIAVIFFTILMFLLPNPYRYMLWIPYGILLPWGIVKMNKTIARIREANRKNL
ncbi:hypothetical protein KR51_00025710 [Rubidibacter lacunae KORDI 51-2]|uniref:Uncharacterized protein n=1 Tax=Rubidibacter lacunae KORDI 51-2 TaxID=582515 RepID=U5DGY6_9CHRO|nr:hypothetical protein [Rubidibacter lacunae]ERN40861.1 hypothetical protein KR51_00025710 [Rubidibacter lacunae KORDI 51-2]